MDGKRTLIEFKTAASDFEDYEVALLDQVTAYKLAEPEVRQIGVCVLVQTKAPKICWHRTDRTPDQVVEYLEKAETVAGQIERRVFYKRVGKWCRQCEFLPMCTGDERTVRETLVRIV